MLLFHWFEVCLILYAFVVTLWTEFCKISFENYFRLRISTVKFSHDFLWYLFLDLFKQIIVLERFLYSIPCVYLLYSGGQKESLKFIVVYNNHNTLMVTLLYQAFCNCNFFFYSCGAFYTARPLNSLLSPTAYTLFYINYLEAVLINSRIAIVEYYDCSKVSCNLPLFM